MYFCHILNGLCALQLPYIVQTRRSQWQACQCVLWGLQSIWLGAQKVRPPHDTHTSPWPLAPLPALSAASDRECHADITRPCWHGDPSITSSGHLGSPQHPTGSVFVWKCAVSTSGRGYSFGAYPDRVAQCHYPDSNWYSPCLLC